MLQSYQRKRGDARFRAAAVQLAAATKAKGKRQTHRGRQCAAAIAVTGPRVVAVIGSMTSNALTLKS